jgi:hypothetical protein
MVYYIRQQIYAKSCLSSILIYGTGISLKWRGGVAMFWRLATVERFMPPLRLWRVEVSPPVPYSGSLGPILLYIVLYKPFYLKVILLNIIGQSKDKTKLQKRPEAGYIQARGTRSEG